MENEIKIGKLYRDLHTNKYVIVENKKKWIVIDLDMSQILCRELENPDNRFAYWAEDAKTTLVLVTDEYTD